MSNLLLLSAAHIIKIHDAVLGMSYGMDGVRESDIINNIPISLKQYLHYNPDATLYEIAGILLEKIIYLHAFLDGNKRTAYSAMITFLIMNDIKFHCTKEEALKFVVDVATHRLTGDELTLFIMKHCHK